MARRYAACSGVRLGHEIVLDDSPDPTQGIEIIDKTEKNFIKIITQKNKIHIECTQDIEVKSSTGNISARQGREMCQ